MPLPKDVGMAVPEMEMPGACWAVRGPGKGVVAGSGRRAADGVVTAAGVSGWGPPRLGRGSSLGGSGSNPTPSWAAAVLAAGESGWAAPRSMGSAG